MNESVVEVKPIVDASMRGLCRKKYPNHPKGCPNWDKKEGCPPKAKMIDKILDFDQPIFAIYNRYPFGEHVQKMYDKHPNWTQRQAECCLYWQGTARKQLKEKIKAFMREHPDHIISTCPEGSGVNLTATMKNVGIELEWPPKKYTYQIVLAGKKVKGRNGN